MASQAEQLRLAAERGDVDAVKTLLQAGAPITPDNEGRTALHLASAKGQASAVKILLDAGAAINTRDTAGFSSLHQAAAEGHEEVVRLLLKRGCHVDTQDDLHGNTALHEVAWKGYSRTLQLLCKDHANLYIKNHGGFTPLHLCCQRGHNQCCRTMLLAACKPDIRNSYGDTALHTSARYGHAGVLRILISAFCNVNETNKNGDSALHISCAMGRNKLTRILLEAGADSKLKNNQGETARDIAERKGFHDVVALLDNPPVTRIPLQQEEDSGKKHHKEHSTTSQEGKKEKKKKSKKSSKVHFSEGMKSKSGNVSPYGCHQSPDPGSFPSLKLMSLPQEPLKSGEQYYADLAGNIKKGPRGLGYTCYCAPFFHHVERKLDAQKKEILERLEGQGEHLDAKIRGLERRTKERLSGLDQRVKASLAVERVECAERIDRRLLRERCELDQRNSSTMNPEMRTHPIGSPLLANGVRFSHNLTNPAHNGYGLAHCRDNYAAWGLARSKSEDMLSDTHSQQNSISLVSGASCFAGKGNLCNGPNSVIPTTIVRGTGNSRQGMPHPLWNHYSQSGTNSGNPISRLKMKCLGNSDLKRESRSESDLTRCHVETDSDLVIGSNDVVRRNNDVTVGASSQYPYFSEHSRNGKDFQNATDHSKGIPSSIKRDAFVHKSNHSYASKPVVDPLVNGAQHITDAYHSRAVKSFRTNHNHDQNNECSATMEDDGSSFV